MEYERKSLLDTFQESLQSLVVARKKNLLSEEEVIKELHTVIHYNNTFRSFIFESFFIEAIKLNAIPADSTLLVSLFKEYDFEDALIKEHLEEGTRYTVLDKLRLEKTKEKFQQALVNSNPESHSWFREEDSIYKLAKLYKTTIQDVLETLREEVKTLQ